MWRNRGKILEFYPISAFLKTSLSLVKRKRTIEDKPRYPKLNELFEKLFDLQSDGRES